MQADKLRELRELLAKATPLLPWTAKYDGDTEVVDASNDTICDDVSYYPAAVDADYQRLIAAAITALPDLLAIAEGAEANRADARRYRWLRANAVFGRMESGGPKPDFALNCDEPEDEWDAAIDAALAGAVAQGES